jgi:hypothetical protein
MENQRPIHSGFTPFGAPLAMLRRLLLAFAVVLALATANQAMAADDLSARSIDVWGRFGVGSWKQTHIVSESLDDAGKVSSTSASDVRTAIVKVDGQHVTLKISVTVEAGGKRYDAEPQIVQHGYYGEAPNQLVRIRDLGKANVSVDGASYACLLREADIETGRQKTVLKLFESAAQAPYVLRRETMFSDSANPAADHQETSEITLLDMPYKVRTEMKTVALEHTVQKNDKGSTVTADITCVEVPGAIVLRSQKEMDSRGHITRRSTAELTDFNAVEEDQSVDNFRPRLFHRRRASRQ